MKGPVTPEMLYALGTGVYSVRARLVRLYDPAPVVIYEGAAILDLVTIDRVAERIRVKGYHDQDFSFEVSAPGISWANHARSSYESGWDSYADEDYQAEILSIQGERKDD